MASQAAPLFTLFVQAGKENSRLEKLCRNTPTEPLTSLGLLREDGNLLRPQGQLF